jgi:hypothetical protein
MDRCVALHWGVTHRDEVAAGAAWQAEVSQNSPFFSTFPMFVPSMSGQNERFYICKVLKKGVSQAVRENYLCGVLLTGFAADNAPPPAASPTSPLPQRGGSSSDGDDDDEEDEPSSPEVVAAARAALVSLYTTHRPDLLPRVDALLHKYAGIEPGKKTGSLFEPFIYKSHLFAKTGSGQT